MEFAKVFSRENFPLYGSPAPVDQMDPLSDKLAGLTVVEKEKEEPENAISKFR